MGFPLRSRCRADLDAEVLRDQPERAAAEPEAIARHFTEAARRCSAWRRLLSRLS